MLLYNSTLSTFCFAQDWNGANLKLLHLWKFQYYIEISLKNFTEIQISREKRV